MGPWPYASVGLQLNIVGMFHAEAVTARFSCGHVLGDKLVAKLLDTVADDVDEWPLRVSFEEMRPNLEDCESQYG